MARERKYGHVELQRGDIAANEPVFVLRGQDKLSPAAIRAYRDLCEQAGCPQAHLDGLEASAAEIEEWQATHHTRLPGSRPSSAAQ